MVGRAGSLGPPFSVRSGSFKTQTFIFFLIWINVFISPLRSFANAAAEFNSIPMKIVRKDYVPDGPGSIKIIPEEPDDLWVCYNLISKGDSVMAVTVRKVLREAASGGRDAERVKLKLEIVVEISAFHTLEIEQHRPFVLRKDIWDSLALDQLQQASDPAASADLAVALMQEGLAHIFLVGKRCF